MVLQHIGAAQRVVLPRRGFLKGLVGLIAAPAVVRAEALMPILVWKPTFGYSSHGGGMGPWVTCRKDDLLGVSLDLPPGHDWDGRSDKWYWRPDSFPQDRLKVIWQEVEARLARQADIWRRTQVEEV